MPPGDLAGLAAGFAGELRRAGLAVSPGQAERFAGAVALLAPGTRAELRNCALATLVCGPGEIDVLDAVLRRVFAGSAADPRASRPAPVFGATAARTAADGAARGAGEGTRELPVRAVASATDRLATRDFAGLTPRELAELATVMRTIVLSTPARLSRRRRPSPHGGGIDLRATLAAARRTGGHPLRLRRSAPRPRPRRLVVLCDISGSMEPYARAMLQLLYCAAGGRRAEVFTFATRLTRLTPVLRGARPSAALSRAGKAAKDWSGGTRIADSLAEFNTRFGRAGLARGAVVLIVSDGWDTGDPADLGRQMARLSRVTHRIVWVNPRTATPGFRPLTGGMAAAWPYCDAVVSAHSLAALGELTAALAGRP
ncbi:hypothetical protein SRB5_02760 [Streptomyces sp. RB5]|uniref:VWFA domain-containing protein n=1 Tax=Streptomyces smaragdinus TaxID=2585196 RepID=A0A7K0C9N9_9ACTN|nr:hypothetical protein [Streptomyces smaragdinus]